MDKAKFANHDQILPSNKATAFECSPTACANCPLAAAGCGQKLEIKPTQQDIEKPKVEPEKIRPYTVVPEKVTSHVAKEVKSKPIIKSEPHKVTKVTETETRFNDIWKEINVSYDQPVSQTKVKQKPTTEQLGETTKKTPEQNPTAKMNHVKVERHTNKTKHDQPVPEDGQHQSERKPQTRERSPKKVVHEAVTEKTSEESRFSRHKKRHERAVTKHAKKEPEMEKPQIFLQELDIQIHDATPLVFEPVLVIDHEAGGPDTDEYDIVEEYTPPMSFEPVSINETPEITESESHAAEAARNLAAQVYENCTDEITDIDKEAYLATMAYERARDTSMSEPFIERANTVNNELLGQADTRYDNDWPGLSDSLPPLAIDGITDPDLGIEKLKSVTATTTKPTLWMKIKLKLARFLLRNMVPE